MKNDFDNDVFTSFEWEEEYKKVSFEIELLDQKNTSKNIDGNQSIIESVTEPKIDEEYETANQTNTQENTRIKRTIEFVRYRKWQFYMAAIFIIVSIITLLMHAQNTH